MFAQTGPQVNLGPILKLKIMFDNVLGSSWRKDYFVSLYLITPFKQLHPDPPLQEEGGVCGMAAAQIQEERCGFLWASSGSSGRDPAPSRGV